MAYKDLREYIGRLEAEGEVQKIDKEVDWDLELGAIIRRSYDLKSPAPFFQKIKGYPEGYRVFGAPVSSSGEPGRFFARLAMAMGMKPESNAVEIMEDYIQKRRNPIKPILVSHGPCKENIQIGDEVDLEKFPIPLIHGGDGGRYIGTWHTIATKDPDTGWVNWGMYRLMLHDKKSMGTRINPYQHIGLMYYQKFEPRNKPMEFAISIGTDPVCALVSALSYNPGINEADIAGGIRGEPVELVRCETVDLAVPATAEIVLEGEVQPYERKLEGPFGEYPGYRVGERAPRPVCRVKAVTHRHNPILTSTCVGVPVDDQDTFRILAAAGLLDTLRSKGFPVRMVYSYPQISIFLTAISTKVPFTNYAKHLAAAVWGASEGKRSHFVIIVDDDVDVTNLNEVMWALTTRCHPDRGIFSMPAVGGGLVSFLSPEERRQNLGASVLFDCTWPKEWPKEAVPVKASFDVLWPQEVQDQVIKNWTNYGYQE
ncbi:MAG: UbiD family decarboxylase [Chloroflexi bacterium]|nr:UbiD family decarboxylase [Chloroflexota bacterium]